MSAASGACGICLLPAGVAEFAAGSMGKVCTCALVLAIAQGSRRQVRSSQLLLPLSCFRLCFSVWLFLAMLTGVRSQLQFEIVLSVQREQNAGPAGLSFQRCVLNSFLPSAH